MLVDRIRLGLSGGITTLVHRVLYM